MKQLRLFITLFLCSLLFSCGNSEINGTSLDFTAEAVTTSGTKTVVSKPLTLGVKVSNLDPGNNYPFTVSFSQPANAVITVGSETVTSTSPIEYDFQSKGTVSFEFTPSAVKNYSLTVTIKNELITKKVDFDIECTGNYYEISYSGIPAKPLVDIPVEFTVSIRENEASTSGTVKTYATVSTGSGKVTFADQQITESASVNLSAGDNTVSFTASTTGKNVIDFRYVNQYGYETTSSVTITTSTPTWEITSTEITGLVPIGEDYTFNVTIKETDAGKNTYTGTYRHLTTNTATLKVNNKAYDQGSTMPLLSGSNVVIINDTSKGTKKIEFIVTDSYGIENTHTVTYTVNTIREITASVDAPSQTVTLGEIAPVKLTISEENYDGTFNVQFNLLSGSGTFIGGTSQTLSAGTHSLGFTPAGIGTHTYGIVISDTNGQSKTLNVTIVCDYSFAVTIQPCTGGTATGGGIFKRGTTCTVVAAPSTNYVFSGWYKYNTNTLISTNTTYEFAVTEDISLEARFSLNTFTIITNATSGGTASGSGTYGYGTICTVKATTSYDEMTFTGWYENNSLISTYATYAFTVTRDMTLEARFELKTYTITAEATTGGTAHSGGPYKHGTTCVLNATPNTGYSFTGWYEFENLVSSSATYSFTVTAGRTLKATFTPNPYTVAATAATGGTASGTGTYNYGTTCTIVATSSTGYTFEGWYNGSTRVSTEASYFFTVSANVTLEARFTANSYTVSTSVRENTGGSVSGSSSGTYTYGSTFTITATPLTGYDFTGWYNGETLLSSNLAYSFSVSGNIAIEAVFTLKTYTVIITTTSSWKQNGITYGDNTTAYGYMRSGGYESFEGSKYYVKHGKTVTITAVVPGTSYGDFWVGWYDARNGLLQSQMTMFSTSQTYSFTVTGNMVLVPIGGSPNL